MSKMREGKGFRPHWWLGATLLAGTAIVLGARARKRTNIRCAYK